MKYTIKKDNKYSKYLINWKHSQGIKSIEKEDVDFSIDSIVEEKIDGELELFEWSKNSRPLFASLGDGVRQELPVLDELVKVLSEEGYTQATIIGELAYVKKRGTPEHFNITMSKIRDPEKKDEEKIHFFPFEINKLDGKNVSDTYEEYLVHFNILEKLFKNSKYVYPVESFLDAKNNFEKAWKKFVDTEKNEGVVVRDGDTTYKIKPKFTLDLVAIAMQMGKGKNRNRLGAFLVALYDGDYFYPVGKVGGGFTEEEREIFYKRALKHKVSEDSDFIWLDPFKLDLIFEVQYDRLNPGEYTTYTFKNKEWLEEDSKFFATISKPRMIRVRDDKKVNKSDLRLSQIPSLLELKKEFKFKTAKVALSFLERFL